MDTFLSTLFRQPSLVEGRLRPAAYRAVPTERSNFGDEEDGLRPESKKNQSLHSLAMERSSTDSFSFANISSTPQNSLTLAACVDANSDMKQKSISHTSFMEANNCVTPPRGSIDRFNNPHAQYEESHRLSIDSNFIDEDMEIEKEVNDFLENNGSILSPSINRNSHRSSLESILRLTTGMVQQTNENLPILEESEVRHILNTFFFN